MTDLELEERRRQIAEDQAAVERAQSESREIAKTLKKSKRVRRQTLPKLQQAGRATPPS